MVAEIGKSRWVQSCLCQSMQAMSKCIYECSQINHTSWKTFGKVITESHDLTKITKVI